MNMKQRAFSLIEVLIVLGILALIASLTLPVIKGNQDKAKYQTSIMNLHEVAKSMEKHYLEKGNYPEFSSWDEVASDQSPLLEYINDVPTGDAWGRKYNITSSKTDYKLEGFAIPGKLGEEFEDYFYLTSVKFRTKSQMK